MKKMTTFRCFVVKPEAWTPNPHYRWWTVMTWREPTNWGFKLGPVSFCSYVLFDHRCYFVGLLGRRWLDSGLMPLFQLKRGDREKAGNVQGLPPLHRGDGVGPADGVGIERDPDRGGSPWGAGSGYGGAVGRRGGTLPRQDPPAGRG